MKNLPQGQIFYVKSVNYLRISLIRAALPCKARKVVSLARRTLP